MSRIAALMASSAAVWVAGPAYGQCAVSSAPDGYVCSGPTTTPQTVVGANPTVSTSPGFGIDTTTTGGNALTITGTGGTLTYNDPNSSTLIGTLSGIIANNSGTGATNVTATGDVTGTANYGIFAVNAQTVTFKPDGSINTVGGAAGTDLTINAASVTGGQLGVGANNSGTGATSVTVTGDVTVTGTALGDVGVGGFNAATATDLTIKANNVSGGGIGVYADNEGTGATSITATGDVTTTVAGGFGIAGINAATATDLTVNANNASSASTGIYARNSGTGATNVTATGNVTGTANYGIFAVNAQTVTFKPDGTVDTITGAAGTDLTVSAASVTGGQSGVYVQNLGTGATSVTSTGTVTTTGTAMTGYGIGAYNDTAATDLTVKANNVSGGYVAIYANNLGKGATSVTATGDVSTTVAGGYGIGAGNSATGTDLTVNANNVSGVSNGIYVRNNGTGKTSMTATGTVTATNTGPLDAAINVANAASGTDLTVAANNASGGTAGILTGNLGTGATSVTATGTVTGTAAGSFGIAAVNTATATNLTVNANNVSGASSGIVGQNGGTGATSVTATGDVTGTANYGILAVNAQTFSLKPDGTIDTLTGAAGTNLMVNAASVTGGLSGIYAWNNGTGATSVTSTGTVTGMGTGPNDFAISAYNNTTATDLTVKANNVSGVKWGIFAENHGTGATSVAAAGDVTAKGEGIYASGDSNTTDLTVTANNVSGEGGGILAENIGTGATSVTSTGDVIATAVNSDGIDAFNDVSATNLTVNANNVSGAYRGIYADNAGTGATSVTATGTATGRFGIYAHNESTATNLTINANNASGASSGILARNNGTGAASVTATGDVTGSANYGILAVNGILALKPDGSVDTVTGAAGTDLTVNAASVTGGLAGIYARNQGTGATSVTATGTVTATATGSEGIHAYNATAATDLMVAANNVSGGTAGIYARNSGTGATSVTATGTATGTAAGSDGIHAYNDTTATDLTVAANNASGRNTGILAENSGTGATSVTATSNVTGTGNYGVLAVNGILTLNADGTLHDITATTGTDLTVNAASVTGGQTGIFAWNAGIGATSVTATGDVTGTKAGSYGIAAFGDTATTDLTVAANNVSGGQFGVVAQNAGTGTTNIVTTGNVTGTAANSEGIYVHNYAGTNGLTVSANDAGGVGSGILAQNEGAGATSVAATGTVTGTGGGSTGIAVYNQTATTGLAVNANNVSGGYYGIDTENIGVGATSIAATGTVTSAAGIGIHAYNAANTTDLTIAANNASGGIAGIYAQNDGTGTTSVTVGGAATGTAADGYGIYAYNDTIGTGVTVNIGGGGSVQGDHARVMAARAGGAGAAAANLSGNAASATGGYAGIFTQNSGTGTTSITTGGIVQGGYAAIVAKSSAGQAIGITNNGTLSNSSGGSGDLAVLASGGPLTLTNNNILTGIVAVDDGVMAGFNDTVTNNSNWNSIGGIDAFGGGRDAVINGAQGTIVGGTSAALAEVTRFTGLETLSNNGVIGMADGGVGDVVHTDGAASFATGSVLAVDARSDGQSDVFAADGAVTLAPGARLTVAATGKPVLGTRDTVLTAAGGLTGTFDFTDQMVTAFAGYRDGYTPTSAYVEFAQLRALAEAGQTRNQIATATGIDGIAGASPVRDAIVMLPDDATARGAFDQLSGEAYASVRSVMTLDARLPRNAVLERLSDGHEGGAVWGQALRNWGDSDGNRNAARVDRNSSGVLAGADLALGSNLTVGVAGGYLDTDLKIPGRGSDGSVKTIHALGYLGAQFGGFRLRAGAGYAWADVDMRRRVSFAGFSDSLQSSYNGSLLQGFAEMGYRIPLGTGYAEPFAGIAAVRASTDGFAEKGGAAALNVAKTHENSTISTAGIRFETTPAGPFSLRGAIGWQHGFGRLEPLNIAAFSGDQPFTVSGVAQSRNAGIANIEARFRLSSGASIGISYDGVLGTGGQDHAIKAGLTVAF